LNGRGRGKWGYVTSHEARYLHLICPLRMRGGEIDSIDREQQSQMARVSLPP